jgi:hypothetical protein
MSDEINIDFIVSKELEDIWKVYYEKALFLML